MFLDSYQHGHKRLQTAQILINQLIFRTTTKLFRTTQNKRNFSYIINFR